MPETAKYADLMPIGGIVPTPMGFLDLCQRSPIDCVHSDTSDESTIHELARAAADMVHSRQALTAHADGRDIDPITSVPAVVMLRWVQSAPPVVVASFTGGPFPSDARGDQIGPMPPPYAVEPGALAAYSLISLNASSLEFTKATPIPLRLEDATRANAPGSEPTPLNDAAQRLHAGDAAVLAFASSALQAPSIQYSLPKPPYDWGNLQIAPGEIAGPSAPPPTIQSPETSPRADKHQPADYARIEMTPENASLVSQANDKVNKTMRAATDEVVYHVPDYWNAPPLVPGVRGDCEDFALEKRRLLVQRGIPAAALSLGLVRTRAGEAHAVLIVSSNQGDYVLDNLRNDVRPWRKTGYIWLARQGPGDDLSWVSLAAANIVPR